MAVVHQFTPVLSYGDAVSDYVLELQKFIRRAGHESEIFVIRSHPRMAHLCRPFHHYEPRRSPDHVLILHLSIGADINLFVWLSPGKKILIYHNITPYEYFRQVNPVLAAECYLGRVQLELFRGEVVLALADSEFNRRELDAKGVFPNATYPIYVSFQKFSRPPRRDLLEMYADGRVNWLFVGRLIPNKRVDGLIRAFALYHHRVEPASRLLVVGTGKGFERHLMQLKGLVRDLRLETAVVFTGHVTLRELIALYQSAHVYVSLSEHEGFCVPLLEAMYFGIPVVAYAAGAVPDTLKGGGVLLRSASPEIVATAVDRVIGDEHFRERVLERQRQVLQYYREFPYETLFRTYLDTVCA